MPVPYKPDWTCTDFRILSNKVSFIHLSHDGVAGSIWDDGHETKTAFFQEGPTLYWVWIPSDEKTYAFVIDSAQKIQDTNSYPGEFLVKTPGEPQTTLDAYPCGSMKDLTKWLDGLKSEQGEDQEKAD